MLCYEMIIGQVRCSNSEMTCTCSTGTDILLYIGTLIRSEFCHILCGGYVKLSSSCHYFHNNQIDLSIYVHMYLRMHVHTLVVIRKGVGLTLSHAYKYTVTSTTCSATSVCYV